MNRMALRGVDVVPMCEKYVKKSTNLHMAFMDLKKAYNKLIGMLCGRFHRFAGRWSVAENSEKLLQGK